MTEGAGPTVTRRVGDITALTVTMQIDGTPALFVLLAEDGSVNRMGSGSPSTADGAMFIGQTDRSPFQEAIAALSDDMLRFTGGYDIPEKRGVPCRLMIGLRFRDGTDDGFVFAYGSESQGPPNDIAAFVHACVAATQPWYEAQRNAAGKPPAPEVEEPPHRPWWRFW